MSAQQIATAIGIAIVGVLLASLAVAAIVGVWKVIAFMWTGAW